VALYIFICLALFGMTNALAFRQPVSRRATVSILLSRAAPIVWIVTASIHGSHASETIGKEEGCSDSSCLGVWDGLLADCPHSDIRSGSGSVSNQDDTPGIFAEPWDYSDSRDTIDWRHQMKILISSIELVCAKRGDKVQIISQEGRYVRVEFSDRLGERSIGEFYFTPDDTTVQFRIAAERGSGVSSLRNVDRAEMIRKQLRYLKLPVLRNRKRSLFFIESELDTFGPGSAALGSPAEMKTRELEGR